MTNKKETKGIMGLAIPSDPDILRSELVSLNCLIDKMKNKGDNWVDYVSLKDIPYSVIKKLEVIIENEQLVVMNEIKKLDEWRHEEIVRVI